MGDHSVQRVADELAIRNLVATFAHLTDMAPTLDEYLELFTEDAVWEFPGDERQGLTPSRTIGRSAIEADRLQRRKDGFQGPGTNTHHVNTTLAVRVHDDGTAEAESYWLFIGDTAGEPQVRSMGHYFDQFVRTENGWKFSSRRISIG